jgi:hypothetical protein
MKLYELAYAARVFQLFYGEALHLESLERESLMDHLEWLNEWGCRHIAKADHSAWVEELQGCLGALDNRLPSRSQDIRSLTETQIAEVGQAFDQVSSLSVRSTDRRTIHFGATAASKTLHALRPSSLPMWDEEFRRRLNLGDGAVGYTGLIARWRSEIESLSADARRFDITDSQIPERVERPGATLVKLTDEYYWITWTKNHAPPSPAQLSHWSKWAQA